MKSNVKRRERIGTVVSDKMDKSIVVKIERTTRHPIYKRIIRKSSKVIVHDEKKEAKLGDKVRIRATKPLSKRKIWTLVEILSRG